MIHKKRIRHLHRSESASNYLQYTMGLKPTSARLKGGELIITFLRLAVALRDFENWTVFFFCW